MDKTIFIYKKQKEALNYQVQALTKEKKENENVSIHLELINFKSASMLNYEKIRRRTIEAEIKKKLVEKNKEHQRNL